MTIIALPDGTYIETPTYAEAQRLHLCFWCGEQGTRYDGHDVTSIPGHQAYQCPDGHISYIEHQYEGVKV